MALETASAIAGLVAVNPTGSDPQSQGDDHIRLLKTVLLATFPNLSGPLFETDIKNGNHTATLSDHLKSLVFTAPATLTLVDAAAIESVFFLQVAATNGAVVVETPTGTINNFTSITVPSGVIAVIFAQIGSYYAFMAPTLLTAAGLSLLTASDIPTIKHRLEFQHSGKIGDNDIQAGSLSSAISETGVTADTYTRPQALVVNAQGRITSIAERPVYVSPFVPVQSQDFNTDLAQVASVACLDFRCIAADGGWSPGDILTFTGSNIHYTNNTENNPMSVATRHGWVLQLGTTIKFILGSDGLYFFTPAGSYHQVTLVKWEMQLRAYVL